MDYDVKTIKTMKKEILPYFLTVYDSEENKHEIVATDGYEIKEENGKYYAVKQKPKYPSSYEECCRIVNASPYVKLVYNLADGQTYSYDVDNLHVCENLRQLRICRDAYWKIAGEEMGLGKPWEPDWSNAAQRKYCIVNTEGNVLKWVQKTTNKIFAFPTEEIRDAFYENFKDLIEKCKKFL